MGREGHPRGLEGGHFVTIADLRIESGGDEGPIAVQIAGDHWRIVNNELSAASATNTAKAAAINGNATMNRNLVDRTPPDSIAMSAAP